MQSFISIGNACPSAYAIKNTGLRSCSYPFDWIVISPRILRDCLTTDFREFLDLTNYYHDSEKYCKNKKRKASCHHFVYGRDFFRHHCPLCFHEHYEYYVRAVYRFRNVCKDANVEKVFICMNIWNPDSVNNTDIRVLQDALSKYVKGKWKIVYLECYGGKTLRSCEFKSSLSDDESLLHYVIHGVSKNVGVKYEDPLDNEIVSKVIRMHVTQPIVSDSTSTPSNRNMWPYYLWQKHTLCCLPL